MFEALWPDLRGGESFEKIAKLNGIVTMILNVHTFGCRQNCAATFQFGSVKAHAHIGDKSAEHQYQVGGFDVLPNVFVAAHGAAVNANVQRMVFGNRALA